MKLSFLPVTTPWGPEGSLSVHGSDWLPTCFTDYLLYATPVLNFDSQHGNLVTFRANLSATTSYWLVCSQILTNNSFNTYRLQLRFTDSSRNWAVQWGNEPFKPPLPVTPYSNWLSHWGRGVSAQRNIVGYQYQKQTHLPRQTSSWQTPPPWTDKHFMKIYTNGIRSTIGSVTHPTLHQHTCS